MVVLVGLAAFSNCTVVCFASDLSPNPVVKVLEIYHGFLRRIVNCGAAAAVNELSH